MCFILGEGNAPFQYQFPSHFICADSKQTVPPGTPPISSPLYAIDIDKFDLLTIGESLFSALINIPATRHLRKTLTFVEKISKQ